MATWVSHLMIADRVLAAIPELDRQAFCVGNIAPDCNVENEDWTQFVPSREITHWMSKERKVASDCERFFDEYIARRKQCVYTIEELSFLLGYYAHLIADAEFQRYIREPARVASAWMRIKEQPLLAGKANDMPEDWDSVKKLINKSERMKDIYTIEAEYLENNPKSGYLTEILGLSTFPDYIDYLPEGAIVRKIGVMGYLPKKEEGTFPFVAMTREEYETFLDVATEKVIGGITCRENEMQQAFMKKHFSRAWKKAELEKIRESERKSHTEIYKNEELYNSNSWLQKPIKTVQELSLLFDKYECLHVLDLGCGIGRNSIYIAERFKDKNCIVDCVDFLDIAIEKLMENAKLHDVDFKINGICKSIEEFEIDSQSYDFIMAVSALEHIYTEESFLIKLHEIKNGLRENGIACFVINSNVTEMNLHTSEIVDAQFEINLPTEKIQAYLSDVFNDCEVLKTSVVKQEYDIPREMFVSHLCTDVVTYVVRKYKS